jgi:hypothetical protein
MSHFICITINGGYIGRWAWCNAGTNGSNAGKGVCLQLPVTDHGAWAGSNSIVRALIR